MLCCKAQKNIDQLHLEASYFHGIDPRLEDVPKDVISIATFFVLNYIHSFFSQSPSCQLVISYHTLKIQTKNQNNPFQLFKTISQAFLLLMHALFYINPNQPFITFLIIFLFSLSRPIKGLWPYFDQCVIMYLIISFFSGYLKDKQK